MQYFLVQVTEKGSENILHNNMYRNEDWSSQKKDRDHGEVKLGDFLLVYFAGAAIDFQKQLRMICKVTRTSDENREFSLERQEIRPISRDEIISKVKERILSQIFLNCGRQGFNICKLTRLDYEKILELSDKLPSTPTLVGAEDLLEDFVVNNWRPREWFGGEFKDLEILRDEDGRVVGQQYDTREVGIIDLLCRDKSTKNHVVVEIKRGNETSDEVAGQLARYLTWVKLNLAQGRSVSGIILSGGHDKKLEYAIMSIPGSYLAQFDVQFKIAMAQLRSIETQKIAEAG